MTAAKGKSVIPEGVIIAGASLAGALIGLSIAKAAETEQTKPIMFGGFIGTIIGTYLVKDMV